MFGTELKICGLSRLEAMCLQTGVDLPVHVIREMISSAVNMIVQLSRFSDGSRKVTYITEMHGQKDGEIQSTDLFRYTTGEILCKMSPLGSSANRPVTSGKVVTKDFADNIRHLGCELLYHIIVRFNVREQPSLNRLFPEGDDCHACVR